MNKPSPQPETGSEIPLPAAHRSTISRYVSFVMLCLTIVVCGFYFYNVIKGFLLPLFMACLLAVIFRPFHEWVMNRLKNRPATAAAITTATIMLIVLLPLAGLITLGVYEANQLVRSRNIYMTKIEEIRRSAGLQKPFSQRLDAIETEMNKMESALAEASTIDESYLRQLLIDARNHIELELVHFKSEAYDTMRDQVSDFQDVPLGRLLPLIEEDADPAAVQAFVDEVEDGQLLLASYKLREELKSDLDIANDDPNYATQLQEFRQETFQDTDFNTPEKRSLKYILTRSGGSGKDLLNLTETFDAKLRAIPVGPQDGDTTASKLAIRDAFTMAKLEYNELRTALLGGPIWQWGVELVNPSKDQMDKLVLRFFTGEASRWLPSITNTATSLVTGLLVGTAIMGVALFYFFMDGAKMINTLMHLSPLDDRHELELLHEFDKVSRAVVLATLLSAAAQGVLGGIGYRIAGLHSVFLLTTLTAVLALIPFVGAAAIWVPCCLYLAFIKEPLDPDGPRTWLYAKAAFLAVYGFLVISMADNVIKPWVLQGQSKLHPLLALLSVLGGVQALGPIGILIGPMVVAFLQVLLTILQREITTLDEELTKGA